MRDGAAPKARFWRTFAAALGWHSIAVLIALGVAGSSLGFAVVTVLLGACISGVWAAFAPRGAVVALGPGSGW